LLKKKWNINLDDMEKILALFPEILSNLPNRGPVSITSRLEFYGVVDKAEKIEE
jgi:hypothetical protein